MIIVDEELSGIGDSLSMQIGGVKALLTPDVAKAATTPKQVVLTLPIPQEWSSRFKLGILIVPVEDMDAISIAFLS